MSSISLPILNRGNPAVVRPKYGVWGTGPVPIPRRQVDCRLKEKPHIFAAETRSLTLFRKIYERGDLPVLIRHSTKSILEWKVPIETIDVRYYLPLFLDGLREKVHPFDFVAREGATELLRLGNVDQILPVIDKIVLSLKNALETHDPPTMMLALQMLQMLTLRHSSLATALVPHYRHILHVLNMFKPKRRRLGDKMDFAQFKLNDPRCLGDKIEETLNVLESTAGPTAFPFIKYMVPTFESALDENYINKLPCREPTPQLIDVFDHQEGQLYEDVVPQEIFTETSPQLLCEEDDFGSNESQESEAADIPPVEFVALHVPSDLADTLLLPDTPVPLMIGGLPQDEMEGEVFILSVEMVEHSPEHLSHFELNEHEDHVLTDHMPLDQLPKNFVPDAGFEEVFAVPHVEPGVEAVPVEHATVEAMPAEHAPVEAMPAEHVLDEDVPAEHACDEAVPVEHASIEAISAEHAPVGAMPDEHVPDEDVTAEHATVAAMPAEHAFDEAVTAEHVPAEAVTAEHASIEAMSVAHASIEAMPAEHVHAEDVPVEHAPVEAMPADHVPDEDVTAEHATVAAMPAEHANVEVMSSEHDPVEAAPTEHAPAEDVHVEYVHVIAMPAEHIAGPAEHVPTERVRSEHASAEHASAEHASAEHVADDNLLNASVASDILEPLLMTFDDNTITANTDILPLVVASSLGNTNTADLTF